MLGTQFLNACDLHLRFLKLCETDAENAWPVECLEQILLDPGKLVVLGKDHGFSPSGYFATQVTAEQERQSRAVLARATLLRLMVRPLCRRQGVGTFLLRQFHELVSERLIQLYPDSSSFTIQFRVLVQEFRAELCLFLKAQGYQSKLLLDYFDPWSGVEFTRQQSFECVRRGKNC